MSFYALAADGVLVLHALVIAFIVIGLALIWIGHFRRWRWTQSWTFRIVHLLAIAYVAAQAVFGMSCPLTTLENHLRQRAGQNPYDPDGFIAYWLHHLIFFTAPPWVFTLCYVSFAFLVLGTFIVARPTSRKNLPRRIQVLRRPLRLEAQTPRALVTTIPFNLEGDSFMPTRHAEATWTGDLKTGNGNFAGAAVCSKGPTASAHALKMRRAPTPKNSSARPTPPAFRWRSRPGWVRPGIQPKRVHTTADVSIDKVGEGFKITKIVLKTEGEVPGIDDAKFQEFAEKTKTGCPVSQALSATPIELQAKLIK